MGVFVCGRGGEGGRGSPCFMKQCVVEGHQIFVLFGNGVRLSADKSLQLVNGSFTTLIKVKKLL